MSKYVKELVTNDLRNRLKDVGDLLLVNVAPLDGNRNYLLRKELRGKGIHLLVVKNSIAQRATEGTALAAGFEGLSGQVAVVWGGQDIVALAKEIVRISKEKQYAGIETRGGVMDGARLSPAEIEKVSNWPTRAEQLGILLGQVLSPGALLSSQLVATGGALASQIQQHAEKPDGSAADATPSDELPPEPAA